MRSSRFSLVLLACSSCLLSGFAPASTLHANGSINWSQFSVVGIDIGHGTPTVTWHFQDSSVSMQVFAQSGADTGFTSQFSNINNWSTLLGASGSLLGGHANADAGAATLSAQSSSGLGFSSTSASASRGGSFSVNGTGLLVFSVPYTLSSITSIDFDAPFGDSGSAFGQLSISASSFSFGQDSSSSESVYANTFASFPGDTQSLSFSGILFAALSVYDGGSGVFSVSASTNTGGFLSQAATSAIPVPAAVWLMASALLALIGLRKSC